MKYYGYMGKILYVNLTTGRIRKEDLDLGFASKFIGDFGFSAKLAFDLIKPGTHPFSPENVILIGAGPLCGTGVMAASKVQAFTKWPVTNTIGPASGPMGFSARLKYAGYDHLVVTGRAAKPVYLTIFDDAVTIRDATDLWGKDIYETPDAIWARHGTDCGVACIGPSGENLVVSSFVIIDKSGTMGRFGLGAVLGSKNLKAIVVGGNKVVKVADPVRFMRVADQMSTDLMNWPERKEFVDTIHEEYDFDRLTRLAGVTDHYRRVPDADMLNQRFGGNATMKERFGPQAYLTRSKKARLACPSCSAACRHVGNEVEWEGKISPTYRSGVTLSTGFHLQLRDIVELDKFMDTLTRYGLDRYAFSSAEFLLHLRELGLVSQKDIEGVPEFGDTEGWRQLARKITYREGIGDVLADGREGLIRRFGREVVEKYGNYMKGADMFQDARLSTLGTQQLDFVVNPQGPTSGKGGMLNPGKFDPAATIEAFRRYGVWIAIDEKTLDRILDTPFKVNTGRLLKYTQDFYTVYSSLGMCMRVDSAQFYGMERLAELYSAATGIETNAQLLRKAGERAWNMMKVLNVREGFSRKDDRFPEIWLQPLAEGNKELRLTDYYKTKVLTAADLEYYLNEYYDERGWELERGIPTKAKLMELGLTGVAEELEKCGVVLK